MYEGLYVNAQLRWQVIAGFMDFNLILIFTFNRLHVNHIFICDRELYVNM